MRMVEESNLVSSGLFTGENSYKYYRITRLIYSNSWKYLYKQLFIILISDNIFNATIIRSNLVCLRLHMLCANFLLSVYLQ